MNKVTVLLSSYNGNEYLREQLDSIFAQQNIEVSVVVRNDGSVNPITEKILQEYAEKENLTYYSGKNLGAGKSFFNLIKNAPDSEYYCFADQDDYWMPEKLDVATKYLEKEKANIPLLYFCNYNLSDANGAITQHAIKRNLRLTRGNALIESFSPGCSMVFNKQLLTLVQEHIPEEDIIHDRWFFLTAMYFGKVIYDDYPHFNYRQHGGNVIGAELAKDKAKDIKRIIKTGKFPINNTANLLLKYYKNELCDSDKKIISNCADYKSDNKALLSLLFSDTYRLAYGDFKRRLYWKIRIILKKL